MRRLVVETRSDLLRARRLLSFRQIELGLYDSGQWVLYYRSTCRRFDSRTGKCRVHGSDEQPRICRIYSPCDCWYRRVYLPGAGRNFLRLNLPRFDFIYSKVTFDDTGEIYGVPDWESMVAGVSSLPLDKPGVQPVYPHLSPVPLDCATGAGNRDTVVSLERRRERTHGENALEDPWASQVEIIAALRTDRCRVLWVPLQTPCKAADLDLLAFRLGFPGVELVVGEEVWGLLLHVQCLGREAPWCPRAGAPALVAVGGNPRARPADRRRTRPRSFLRRSYLRLDRHAFEAVRGEVRLDTDGGMLCVPPLVELRRILARTAGPDGDKDGRPRPLSA